MLGLFYSLAFHMYQALGGWPTSIGVRGFPPALITHADIVFYFFLFLFFVTAFGAPVGILMCLLRTRFKHCVPYLASFALSFAVCCAVMQLAPDPFLHWWWD